MDFIIANEHQKNIGDSDLSLLTETKTAIEGDADMTDDQKSAAGKAFDFALKQINADVASVLKIGRDRLTNKERFAAGFSTKGSNSGQKTGLVSTGISLFGYGEDTY